MFMDSEAVLTLLRADSKQTISQSITAIRHKERKAIDLESNNATIPRHRKSLTALQLAKLIHGIVFADEKYIAKWII